MKNPQPFITTDLREEFIKEWGHEIDMYDDGSPIYPASIYDVADWWLQKMSEQKERLIKEVEGMKKELKGGVTEVKTQQDLWKATMYNQDVGYNQALEDILRRLQSV